MDFFAAMFGFPPDDITTPTMVTFGSSTDSEDNIDVVEAMVYNGNEWVEFGLDIVIVIKAINKEHSFALLEKMNFPFIKKGDN